MLHVKIYQPVSLAYLTAKLVLRMQEDFLLDSYMEQGVPQYWGITDFFFYFIFPFVIGIFQHRLHSGYFEIHSFFPSPPPRFHMLQVLCMLAYNLIIVIMLVMIVTIMKGSETHRIALTNHFHSLPHLIFKAPRGFNICSISHSRTKSKPNMAFSENLAFLIPWTK